MRNIFNHYISDSFNAVRTSKAAIANGIIIGTFVGIMIAFYDWVITDLISFSLKTKIPYLFLGVAPLVGMILTGIIIKKFSVDRTSMADEVIFAFHTSPKNLELRKSIPKFFASMTTIGFGASAGLEGSSKWVGASLGIGIQRLINFFKPILRIEGNLTDAMMTGASAAIGAIFKAPLSGTIMALESPYKKDFAHEPLVQSFIGAVMSYTVFTAIRGSGKFFLINLQYKLRWEDILLCTLIGFITGTFSSTFLKILKEINSSIASKLNIYMKYFIGGLTLTAIAYLSLFYFGHYTTLFSGSDVINDLFANKYGVEDSLIIALLKSFATIVTFAFGGVGGLFLPSATIGACIGQMFQLIFHFATPGILPFIGISSFIAASYNGLLFGPILIAEISGEPSLVVLGIIASTVSYLVSNGTSNSSHQKEHR